jgi:hypothetical protein
VASAIDLLAATGQTLAAGRLDLSRVVAIGHSFEISADDGPTRDWVFDGQRRGLSGSAGRAAAPDFAVRFTISGQALRDLTAPDMVDRIMVGRIHGPSGSRATICS